MLGKFYKNATHAVKNQPEVPNMVHQVPKSFVLNNTHYLRQIEELK